MYCLSKICCFCLRSNEQLKLLNKTQFSTSQMDMIKFFIGESLFLELGHVLLICKDCTRQLVEVHSFWQMSVKNNKILTKYLQQLRKLGNNFGDIQIQINDIMYSTDPVILTYKDKFRINKSTYTAENNITEDVKFIIKIEDLKIENEDDQENTQELSENDGDTNAFETSTHESIPEIIKSNDVQENIVTKIEYIDDDDWEYKQKLATANMQSTNRLVLGNGENRHEDQTNGEEREFKIEIHDDFKEVDPLKCESNEMRVEFPESIPGTREKPHKCETCGKSFSSRGHLSCHVLIHTGEKPHKCETCGKSFTQKGSLASHMLIHIGAKPHKCEICEKPFTHVGNLRRHMFQHTGEKPHVCQTCGKPFSCRSHLSRHMLTHSGEKPHKCEICGKSFTSKNNVTSHMLLHTGEKPHKCQICGRDFTQKSTLTSHMLQHSGAKPHKCETCGKSFTHRSKLQRHYSLHTSNKR